MVTACYEYKCRRCGVVHDGACTGLCRASMDLLFVTIWNDIHSGPEMARVHDCADGGGGVSDLIGYRVEKEGEE